MNTVKNGILQKYDSDVCQRLAFLKSIVPMMKLVTRHWCLEHDSLQETVTRKDKGLDVTAVVSTVEMAGICQQLLENCAMTNGGCPSDKLLNSLGKGTRDVDTFLKSELAGHMRTFYCATRAAFIAGFACKLSPLGAAVKDFLVSFRECGYVVPATHPSRDNLVKSLEKVTALAQRKMLLTMDAFCE